MQNVVCELPRTKHVVNAGDHYETKADQFGWVD